MKTNGRINLTKHYSALGIVERIEYAWEGGDVVAISLGIFAYTFERVPQPGKRFALGPFTLRCLEEHLWADEIIACRERPFVARLRYAWVRSMRLVDIAYRRAIITLAVWKLAEYSDARFPTWRDIYALRWLVPYANRRAKKRWARMIARINETLQ